MRHREFMDTKTISIEADAYELLRGVRRSSRESISQVVRRLVAERPAQTAGELEEMMKGFEGKGAGPRRAKRRAAA
jgi:predicted CopG family antitoxin